MVTPLPSATVSFCRRTELEDADKGGELQYQQLSINNQVQY